MHLTGGIAHRLGSLAGCSRFLFCDFPLPLKVRALSLQSFSQLEPINLLRS